MHQTVNLTSPTSVVRIHPLPPQNRGTHFGYLCFVCGVRGCFTEPQFGLPPQGGALPRLAQVKRQYPPPPSVPFLYVAGGGAAHEPTVRASAVSGALPRLPQGKRQYPPPPSVPFLYVAGGGVSPNLQFGLPPQGGALTGAPFTGYGSIHPSISGTSVLYVAGGGCRARTTVRTPAVWRR